jgi:hypothetical protein
VSEYVTEPAAEPSFGVRLQEAMDTRGQLCVGIDPHPGLLSAWGLNDDAAALERFSLTVLEAVGELAAAVKPQVALFAAACFLTHAAATLRAPSSSCPFSKKGTSGSGIITSSGKLTAYTTASFP